MSDQSHVVQLYTTTYLRFVTTIVISLHLQLSERALHQSMDVVGLGNTTPIVLDFTKLTYPKEWKEQYVSIFLDF